MKYAVFGDIHGYLDEYLSVIEAVFKHNPTHIICLGDIVEGGKYSSQICNLIRDHQLIRCVRGNHDENNDVNLDAENFNWLNGLPISIVENKCCFIHESPAVPSRKINSAYEAWRAMDETEHRLVIVGDSHISSIYTNKGMTVGEARSIPFDYGIPINLSPEARYVISPGAIGYSRDNVHKPKYGIIDLDQSTMLIDTTDFDTTLNN